MNADPKKYRLPLGARISRWWRARHETLSLFVVVVMAIAAITSFLVGNPRLGAVLAVVGLLYLAYAYTNWFNDMS